MAQPPRQGHVRLGQAVVKLLDQPAAHRVEFGAVPQVEQFLRVAAQVEKLPEPFARPARRVGVTLCEGVTKVRKRRPR